MEKLIKRVLLWDVITGNGGVKEDFAKLAQYQLSNFEATFNPSEVKKMKAFLPEFRQRLGWMYGIARLLHFKDPIKNHHSK